MKTHTRRAVAYIAGRLIADQISGSVYDYQEGRHVSMAGNVTGSNVAAFDYDQKCHIAGSSSLLYHYGNCAHLALQLGDAMFSGYDYDSNGHFSGSVNSKHVSLYDYETTRYYNYSI